jgi:hypothetical protein
MVEPLSVHRDSDEAAREYRAMSETEIPAGPLLQQSHLGDRLRVPRWLAIAFAAGCAILMYGFLLSRSTERGRGTSTEELAPQTTQAPSRQGAVGQLADPREAAFPTAFYGAGNLTPASQACGLTARFARLSS